MRSKEYLQQLNVDDSVTLEIGETVSYPLNTYGTSLVGLIIPSTFSGTQLSIQGALSGSGTFYTMKNSSGEDVSITINGAGYYALSPQDFTSLQFIKFVSDSTQVTQDCIIQVITRAI
jgi:hypothetical protein